MSCLGVPLWAGACSLVRPDASAAAAAAAVEELLLVLAARLPQGWDTASPAEAAAGPAAALAPCRGALAPIVAEVVVGEEVVEVDDVEEDDDDVDGDELVPVFGAACALLLCASTCSSDPAGRVPRRLCPVALLLVVGAAAEGACDSSVSTSRRGRDRAPSSWLVFAAWPRPPSRAAPERFLHRCRPGLMARSPRPWVACGARELRGISRFSSQVLPLCGLAFCGLFERLGELGEFRGTFCKLPEFVLCLGFWSCSLLDSRVRTRFLEEVSGGISLRFPSFGGGWSSGAWAGLSEEGWVVSGFGVSGRPLAL